MSEAAEDFEKEELTSYLANICSQNVDFKILDRL